MADAVFRLPDLGEGLEGAEVVRWLVVEGDQVELNQPIVEVLTAKTNLEIPSPFAGRVTKIHVTEGSIVPVGGELVTFALGVEEKILSPQGEADAPKVLVGYGVKAEPAIAPKSPRRLRPPDPGSGRRQRRGGELSSASPVQADMRIPVRGVRRLIAERMTASWTQIPHVTSFLTLDASELESFRRELGAAAGLKISPLPIVVCALVKVCQDFPKLNSSFSADSGEIIVCGSYHVGIAVDTEDGLLVPVVRDADRKGIVTLAREIAEIVAAVRERRATPEQLSGSTITVTNTGTFGAEFGTPIINAPEAAILALGVIEPRALVVEGEIQVRPATTLSLSFDHRVLDGAEVGRAFLALRSLLQEEDGLRSLPTD